MVKDTVSQMNLTSNKCTTLCLSTIISLAATTSFCSAENIAWENGRRPLLGVQRWDMYSGKGATQQQELGYLPGKQGFLKDPEWHDRAPFFCRLTADVDWVAHPSEAGPLWFNHPFSQELLQKSMDQEIRFAHNAGIDFFIYNGPARSYEQAGSLKKDGYDAFMDYAGGYGGKVAERDKAPTYAEATADLINTYESKFLNQGLPFIPPCTSMQYPWPRAIDKKTGKPMEKWYHYQWPRKGDLAARIKAAFDFVAAHPKACEAQVVTMYSWNEHSEGGGLCPTMGAPPEYEPVTAWLDEAAAALADWRYH